MLVMPDSSLFVALMKRRLDPAETLLAHYESPSLATCGMVRVEVMRGLRPSVAQRNLSAFMDVMINVLTTNALWNQAALLGQRMMMEGITIKGPDLIIASCALQASAAVITLDSDFSRVPGLIALRPEWLE